MEGNVMTKELTKNEIILLDNGFDGQGSYWSKFTDTVLSHDGLNYVNIHMTVELNEKYDSMLIKTCDCVVECCGRDLGIHPFSIKKIEELFKEEFEYQKEIHGL
jgi:hypothetical protein